MGIADDLLENTRRSLARLIAVTGSPESGSMPQAPEPGWGVTGTLAHLAFYDYWVAERWRRWLAEGHFQDLPDDLTELMNAAGSRGWQAVNPRLATSLACTAAREITELIDRLPRAALDDAVTTGRPAMIDRSLHWNPHLDEIERLSQLSQRRRATAEPAGGQPAAGIASDSGEARGSVWYVVIDSTAPEAAAQFWSALLDAPRHGPYVAVGPLAPDGPSIAFQRVPERKQRKNRLHLDVAADNASALAERVVALGGGYIQEFEEQGNRWIVMGDPDGNEFCVTEIGHLARPPGFQHEHRCRG
jgi:predicted enzyme related to lactoylglutathione lyase